MCFSSINKSALATVAVHLLTLAEVLHSYKSKLLAFYINRAEKMINFTLQASFTRDSSVMSASVEKSANGLKVSWPAHTGARGILIELKDADEDLEWILMPRSSSAHSSLRLRGTLKSAFIGNQQVEIRGIPEHVLSAHEFETTVYSCDPQATPGTVSSYLATGSYRATCSTSGHDDHLERLFSSQLALGRSTTVPSSHRGECYTMFYNFIKIISPDDFTITLNCSTKFSALKFITAREMA